MANSAKDNEPVTLFSVVAAALIDRSGRVLIQRRPAGKAMAGLWEFPGGKIEPGETPEVALVRELEEELGITVAVEDLTPGTFASAPIGERQLLLLLYVCRTWGDVPKPLDAEALQWVRPEALAAIDMPPADRPLAAWLCGAIG